MNEDRMTHVEMLMEAESELDWAMEPDDPYEYEDYDHGEFNQAEFMEESQ